MRTLGMDLGTKTLGLAISDKQGIIASPYKLIKYNNIEDAVNEVLEIIEKEKVDNLVLGLPKNMNNSLGFASERSLNFKKLLEEKTDLKIYDIAEKVGYNNTRYFSELFQRICGKTPSQYRASHNPSMPQDI